MKDKGKGKGKGKGKDDNIIKLQTSTVYGEMKSRLEQMQERNSTPSLIKRLLADYEYEEAHGRDEFELHLNVPELVIISCVLERRVDEIIKALEKETEPEYQELLRRYLRMHQLTLLEFRELLEL